VEPSAAAERAWVDHVNAVVAGTLLPKANSWWMGANIPGKPRQVVAYAGGFPAYRQHAEQALASPDAYRLLGAPESEPQR
jgi:cyclohexanone monooxygenase